MEDYKPSEPAFILNQKRKFYGEEDDTPTPLQEQNYIFDNNFERLVTDILNGTDDNIAISEMIGFLANFNKLFFSSNNIIIPQILEKNIFEIILNQITDMHSIIFPLFKEMVHCQTESLYLLLQNNFCHALISSMFNYDDKVCQCSIECLIEIISRDSFFYVLIFSTNIIEIFFNFLNCPDIQDNKVIYCFVFLSEFFNYGPMPDEHIRYNPSDSVLLNKYHDFIPNCKNPEFFNEQLFKDFIENGIIISSNDSPFYQLLELALSKASNSKNSYIINNYLYIIYYIIRKNLLTAETLLFKLPFYDFFEKWFNDHIADTDTFILILKINGLLYSSEIPIEHSIIIQSITTTFYIFDYYINNTKYSNCESEDAEEEEEEEEYDKEEMQELECEAIITLISLVENPQSREKCIRKLQKRREKILNQFLNGPYYAIRKYAQLILSIAVYSKYNYKDFLTPNVLDRIFNLMEEQRKKFVDFALDSFNSIFLREVYNQQNDFIKIFYNCQGVDFLYKLLDSTSIDGENSDEEIHQKTNKILDDYFSNKENQ